MGLVSFPLLSMMTAKLSWLNRRTDVIAENIANANTPGYRAQELAPVSFRDMVTRQMAPQHVEGTMAVTDAAHLTGSRATAAPFKVANAPDAHVQTLSRNDVSVEQQLVRLGETQVDYQATLNLYGKHLDMIRTAIGRGRG